MKWSHLETRPNSLKTGQTTWKRTAWKLYKLAQPNAWKLGNNLRKHPRQGSLARETQPELCASKTQPTPAWIRYWKRSVLALVESHKNMKKLTSLVTSSQYVFCSFFPVAFISKHEEPLTTRTEVLSHPIQHMRRSPFWLCTPAYWPTF